MTILIYNNTVICQYGNIDINKDIGCRTLSEWSIRQPGKCAASVVWGVVRNAPEEFSTYLPCCSGVKRSFAPGQFRHVCGIHSNAVHGENWLKGTIPI